VLCCGEVGGSLFRAGVGVEVSRFGYATAVMESMECCRGESVLF
jgi:hypothetical protein